MIQEALFELAAKNLSPEHFAHGLFHLRRYWRHEESDLCNAMEPWFCGCQEWMAA